jgi:hypothetical protein
LRSEAQLPELDPVGELQQLCDASESVLKVSLKDAKPSEPKDAQGFFSWCLYAFGCL